MSFQFNRQTISKENTQETEPFGTLLCVRHESSGGSMAYRSEFSIEVNAQEIVRCAYWSEQPAEGMVRREHIPVTTAQWADVEETVRTLWPLFQKVKPKPPIPSCVQTRVLDGGDYSRWFLTRQTSDGVCSTQYYQPDDRRIRTLIELLRELAEPLGREIPRFDPPELCGVFFSHNKNSFSFQCTPWDDTKDAYRFIVYEKSKRDDRSVYERVPIRVWDEVRSYMEPLEKGLLSAEGDRETISCTLYYSDGKQKRTAPDAKTAEGMHVFFSRLTDRVQSEIERKEDI